jgi:cytochrome c biogenesis protein CcmG/thiol:disulfide interchange protein DsbE
MEVQAVPPNETQAEKAPEKGKSRRRSIAIFVIVSLINVALLAFLWMQLLTPAQNKTAAKDPLVGKQARNFTLAALNGYTVPTISLTDFKGKPVVLNVWSSSCGPCIHEAPLLQATWQSQQAKEVVFLGLDFQDTKSDGLSFLQKYGITYPNALDATGSVAIDYGVTGTPETFFINRHGVIVNHVIGELTVQTLQSNLQLVSR